VKTFIPESILGIKNFECNRVIRNIFRITMQRDTAAAYQANSDL
jgi:hypothetical protein